MGPDLTGRDGYAPGRHEEAVPNARPLHVASDDLAVHHDATMLKSNRCFLGFVINQVDGNDDRRNQASDPNTGPGIRTAPATRNADQEPSRGRADPTPPPPQMVAMSCTAAGPEPVPPGPSRSAPSAALPHSGGALQAPAWAPPELHGRTRSPPVLALGIGKTHGKRGDRLHPGRCALVNLRGESLADCAELADVAGLRSPGRGRPSASANVPSARAMSELARAVFRAGGPRELRGHLGSLIVLTPRTTFTVCRSWRLPRTLRVHARRAPHRRSEGAPSGSRAPPPRTSATPSATVVARRVSHLASSRLKSRLVSDTRLPTRPLSGSRACSRRAHRTLPSAPSVSGCRPPSSRAGRCGVDRGLDPHRSGSPPPARPQRCYRGAAPAVAAPPAPPPEPGAPR